MNEDIFSYWSKIDENANIHPDDKEVFRRAVGHSFKLDCLPIPYFGPLRTAPVVLLFLSPGYRDEDSSDAEKQITKDYYKRQRSGVSLLPTRDENPKHYEWWISRLRQFGIHNPDTYADKVAFLNIGAYHSNVFKDWHMLTALPSSRFLLNWTQMALFPEAEKGHRVVVCLRSHSLWGLRAGNHYGAGLFAPNCNRGGFMCKKKLSDMNYRKRVEEAVRNKLIIKKEAA